MPKFARSETFKIKEVMAKYPKEFKITADKKLLCIFCNTLVKCNKTFFIDQHRNTDKHKSILNYKNVMPIENFCTKNEFSNDIVKAFLAADIPLWKLRNLAIRRLFRTMGYELPSEQTCRSKISKIYEEEVERVKSILQKSAVFFIIDETKLNGNIFVNILAGEIEKPTKTYLLDCIPLTISSNAQIIIDLIIDATVKYGIQRNNLYLLLSDAAPYMTAAGKSMKIFFPHLFHVTCIAHLMHNCAMKIRSHYHDVDVLIASVKRAIIKNKTRENDFILIGIPPEPIITRWGSWLLAAMYYATKFPDVRNIVRNWSGKGYLLNLAKTAVEKPNLTTSLIEICEYYSNLTTCLIKLENPSFSIYEAFDHINELQFGSDPCEIKNYIRKRIDKNEISEIINATRQEISPYLYSLLRKSQCTSVAVERSFSLLNKLLAKDRNFNPENIRKYLMIYYNMSSNQEENLINIMEYICFGFIDNIPRK